MKPKLRLYLLKIITPGDLPPGSEPMLGCVVCATTEIGARGIAEIYSRDEGKDIWHSSRTSCQDIGKPTAEIEAGLVLRDAV